MYSLIIVNFLTFVKLEVQVYFQSNYVRAYNSLKLVNIAVLRVGIMFFTNKDPQKFLPKLLAKKWPSYRLLPYYVFGHNKGWKIKYFWNMFNGCHQVDINLFQKNFGQIRSNNEIKAKSLFMSWDINRDFLFLVQMIWNLV